MTSRLPNLTQSLKENNISVGKFLQATKRSCPKRNKFLGEKFCIFAVKLKVYIDAVNNAEQFDTNLLHKRYKNCIEKLCEPNAQEPTHLKLPSTGQFISENIFKSLSTWKRNCHDEVWVNFA